METEQTLTPQTVEGNSGQTPETQEANTAAEQSAEVQSQETVVPAVDGNQQQSSSQQQQRPRPSEFYKLRQLEKQLREQNELIKSLGSQIQQTQKPVTDADNVQSVEDLQNKFWQDPYKFQIEREKLLKKEFDERISRLNENLPKQLEELQTRESIKKQEQEALELLFPSDKTVQDEPLDERMARDPARAEAIRQIIEEYGFRESLRLNPKKASLGILKIYNAESNSQKVARQANPSAPKKEQMRSVQTGIPQKGDVKNMNLNELKAEREKLSEELERNPKLRFDDSFIQRSALLRDNLNKRYAELSSNQK